MSMTRAATLVADEEALGGRVAAVELGAGKALLGRVVARLAGLLIFF